MKKIRILSYILMLQLLVFPTSSFAEPYSLTMQALGYPKETTIYGPNTGFSTFLPVPYQTIQRSGTINLNIIPSPALNNGSSLSFYVDDRFLTTISMDKVKKDSRVILPVVLEAGPSRFLKIDIKSNLFITDSVCKDYETGNLFYQLNNSSSLSMDVLGAKPNTIDEFFTRLYKGVEIIIPDNPSLGEITAAIWTHSILQKKFYYQPISIVYQNQLQQANNIPKIWIKTANRLTSPRPNNITNGMYVINSGDLVVTADDDESLKKTVKFGFGAISSLSVIPAASKQIEGNGTLPVGGEAVPLVGVNSVQNGVVKIPFSYSIYPGQLENIPEQLMLHLEGNYTPSVSLNKPVRMDALFNDNLIYSKMLDNAGSFSEDIPVPETIGLLSKNNLRVELYYVLDEGKCQFKERANSAQIFSSSYAAGKGNFPVKNYQWNNFGLTLDKPGTLLLDDELSPSNVLAAAKMLATLNKQIDSKNYVLPEIKTISDITSIKNSQYIIVMATSSKIPQVLSEGMPLGIGSDFAILRKEDSSTIYRYNPTVDLVVGQVGVYKGIPTLMLTSSRSPDTLLEMADYLNNPTNNGKVKGNVFVYKKDTEIFSFDSREGAFKIERKSVMSWLEMVWLQYRNVVLVCGWLLFTFLFASIYFTQKKNNERNIKSKSPDNTL